MKLINKILVIILLLILFSCEKNKINTVNVPNEALENITQESQTVENKILTNDFENIQNTKEMIENYFVNEVLNGMKYTGDIEDPNGVVKIYGNPLKENIRQTTPIWRNKNYVNFIRTLIYDDLIHYYYTFENGTEMYVSVIMIKPHERLKTIKIGDNISKLKEIFGNNIYEFDNNPVYQGLNLEVIFIIRNDKIMEIIGNYLLDGNYLNN
jgi:hypothetical protein